MALGLQIRLTGGKNLAKLDFGDRAFVRHSLAYVAREIRAAVKRGQTADGRTLPPYSKKYEKALRKRGRSTTPDMEDTGRMWRSLRGTVTKKQEGALRFSGGRPGQEIKQRKKDGSYRLRRLTNQMLASILAFRRTGKPMPTRPLNFVPRGRFMDIGEKQGRHITRLYDRTFMRKVRRLPPALELTKGDL